MKTWRLVGGLLLLVACSVGPKRSPWIELFDGESLAGFVSSEFGGDGPIAVRDGALQLGIGSPLTGVTWTGALPHGRYELEVCATRLRGHDFFCGLTFPVDGAHLTLVLGGWGGAVSGLSSFDDNDASRNATRTLRYFESGRPYRILLRVDTPRIEVLIDDEPFLQADLTGHELTLRPEVELSRPLGLATFATEAAVSTLRWRPL